MSDQIENPVHIPPTPDPTAGYTIEVYISKGHVSLGTYIIEEESDLERRLEEIYNLIEDHNGENQIFPHETEEEDNDDDSDDED